MLAECDGRTVLGGEQGGQCASKSPRAARPPISVIGNPKMPNAPTELYRSPAVDVPLDVARLEIHRVEHLETEEQQVEWAKHNLPDNTALYRAAADRAATATPPPPAARPDLATARAQLRSAISEYAELHEAHQRADASVMRAQERVNISDGLLSDYRDLEGKVTAWYADAVRSGSDDELPYDLRRQLEERGRILDRNSALRKALLQLQSEAAEAKASMEHADTKRGAAAAMVVLATMDGLASELAELDARSNAIRQQLNTASASLLAVPNAALAPSLGGKAVNVLLQQRPTLVVDTTFSRALRGWHQRLMSDLDSVLEEADAVDPPAAA